MKTLTLLLSPINTNIAAEWRSKLADDIVPKQSITVGDVEKFRKGSFEDATDNIKAKWFLVMLHFLPIVNAKYTKWDVKQEKPVSKITTASDEAIIYWFIQNYVTGWEKDQADKEQQENDERQEDQPKKRRKREGKHYSRTELDQYHENCETITTAREDPIEGKGWDNALMIEAARQKQELLEQTTKKANQHANEDTPEEEASLLPVPKKRYVFTYEPMGSRQNASELLGESTNGTAV